MFTTAELLEIEILLNEKWMEFVFTPMILDEKQNEILINDLDFKDLLDFTFPEHYKINNETIAVDYNIFKILQCRYFRSNETLQILN